MASLEIMAELKDGVSISRGYGLYSGYDIYLHVYTLFNTLYLY